MIRICWNQQQGLHAGHQLASRARCVRTCLLHKYPTGPAQLCPVYLGHSFTTPYPVIHSPVTGFRSVELAPEARAVSAVWQPDVTVAAARQRSSSSRQFQILDLKSAEAHDVTIFRLSPANCRSIQ
eukprot:GHUV01050247.1.p1 GENE.GHUV01050247.1~~GHUV01050247.1.p1  ORF type:complete len:126 (-),score=22.66 GHUV01050247.1:198-575(-)